MVIRYDDLEDPSDFDSPREKRHEAEYLAALRFAGRQGPEWRELTPEQRFAIRQENFRYEGRMRNLGDAIANGNKRPLMHLPRGVTEPCEDCDKVYGCTMNCSGPVTLTPRTVEPPPKRGKKK